MSDKSNVENFLFGGQDAKIKKFQSLPWYGQYLALPVGVLVAFFQVLAHALDNPLPITLILLLAKPIDNVKRWWALRRGERYSSFFDE